MPALPLHEAGKYVAAAYVIFLGLVLVYVTIMAIKLARIGRDVEDLAQALERTEEREPEAEARPPVAAGGGARRAET
jgi:hypothetical protein